ncbi:alkaline phosphatase family protein, partial [Planctomycetaceae bacterium]|nr:alkaline phosphatase family protein [Planctomycetaceae bacterium]
KSFPLAAASSGPAACFGLIGRIGTGSPFVVGDQSSMRVKSSGRLMLGINDFDHSDNAGQFEVIIERGPSPRPVRMEEQILEPISQPVPPVDQARVVVFYMDGLRPDVVHEMSAMGHLPNITNLFVEGGTCLGETFTGFPSDTITSNGTMWTGCFSDRHGLKGQVRFSRRSLASESYLEPLGPNRSSRLLQPEGADSLIQKAQIETLNFGLGDGAGDRWGKSQTSGVPPLYEHLQSRGQNWATGILPMMTEVPPMLWTRSLIRNMPYFRAHEAWKYIDDANTHFALKHLISQDLPVTIIWLPETDSVSHKESRGQFGSTRRTIALADRLIGKVVSALETRGLLASTYFMLVSDHGHHGGRDKYLTKFDLANELFHRPRTIDQAGNWIGGGLGLSVRQHRFWNRHPEDSTRQFVFIDGDSDGAARVFLPKDHYQSEKWMGTSQPADLLEYRINEQASPVNFPLTIAATRGKTGTGEWGHPIDLVLMKLSENFILITTHDRGQAVIDRRMTIGKRWVYRYRTVHNVRPLEDGTVNFDELEQPTADPLGISLAVPVESWGSYLSEQEWLQVTAKTDYPDSVVAITRHLLWQDNLKYREDEYAADLVVTAKRNWYFGTKSSPGTMHGYPFRESMRATWFVSGPTIRRGARLQKATRLADLTPTILDLIGFQDEEVEFDGRVVSEIYTRQPSYENQRQDRPVYWQDVDLSAWEQIEYRPSEPYEYLPWTMNRPDSPLDLNIMAGNLVTLGDISFWRLFDDVISPLTGGEKYVVGAVESLEQSSWSLGKPVGEAAGVVDLSGLTLGDYSQTSIGHVKRVDRAIDWIQDRSSEIDQAMVSPIGYRQSPPAKILNGGVDGAQFVIWETYRFVQRVTMQILDEKILNGIENVTDKSVNHFRTVPAERKVHVFQP